MDEKTRTMDRLDLPASRLIATLQGYIAEHGDMPVTISISEHKAAGKEGATPIIVRGPLHVACEEYEDGFEVCIRDWPY
jgi:hypothetical protein